MLPAELSELRGASDRFNRNLTLKLRDGLIFPVNSIRVSLVLIWAVSLPFGISIALRSSKLRLKSFSIAPLALMSVEAESLGFSAGGEAFCVFFSDAV